MKLRPVLLLILVATLAPAQHAPIVREVRAAIAAGDFTRAGQLLAASLKAGGVTSAYVEALSWMGRGKLDAKDLAAADRYASETQRLALELLKQRPLDDDSSLPLALGAAIEVRSQVLNARGAKAEAITFLRDELLEYRPTSIRARIQKNLHLINLEGRHAPALDVSEFLGDKPKPLAQLKGSVVVLFFWAHWCGDCKAQAPILARLGKEFSGRGLVLLGPTQRYGYAAQGHEATPDEERAYIDQIRLKYYAGIDGLKVPLNEENFRVYGSSTTPTLVLIDRAGLVRLYHPGLMTYEELRPRLEALVQTRAAQTALSPRP